MKRILIIVGTRPNFIKVTQFRAAAANVPDVDVKIAHTGQHHNENMADVFFRQFGLFPDYFLNISASSPNTQMAETMLGVEKVSKEYQPSLIIVVGDVNSTLAAAVTANKIGLPVAHLESGLRSGDKRMPEEINRILTDNITDHFFITEQSGVENLSKEGLTHNHHLVGNTMIDTLVAFEDQIAKDPVLENLGLTTKEFILMTMHRPSNVDTKEQLSKVVELIEALAETNTVVFPIHPRTTSRLSEFDLTSRLNNNSSIVLSEPLGYFSFQKLIAECKFVITDSGGIQEESTFRQVPCLTLRENTERPSTIELGTNELVEFDTVQILEKAHLISSGNWKRGEIPPLWDGKATNRIIEILASLEL